jgi:hypothetical protein
MSPPSPTLTAVDDEHAHHGLSDMEPKSPTTGGVPRTKSPIADDALTDISTIERGLPSEKLPVSATGPVPDPSLDPDAKTGKSHIQLEHTNPDLYHALEKEHVYLTHQDEEGNYLVRSTKSDAQNPRNWADWKRYGVVGLASWLNILV